MRLADELGVPVAHAAISVDFFDAAGVRRGNPVNGETDERGEIDVGVPGSGIATTATVLFPGSPFFERSEREVRLGAFNPAVTLGLPSGEHLDLKRASHTVTVAAESGWQGTLDVRIQDELGRRLGNATLLGATPAELEVVSSVLGDPGTGRLVVVRADDGSELTQHAIVRVSDTIVALQSDESGDVFKVSGTVSIASSGDKLANVPVTLFLDDVVLKTTQTNEVGRFAAELTDGELQNGGRLTARFDSSAEWYRSASSPSVEVAAQSSIRSQHIAAGIGTLGLALFMMWSLRREGTKQGSSLEASNRSPPSAFVKRAASPGTAIVQVVDARTSRPIEGAQLSSSGTVEPVQTDHQGVAVFAHELTSRSTLTARASGYEQRTVSLEFMRPGFAIVRLTSNRDLAFALLQRLAPYVSTPIVGRTPREIIRALRGRADSIEAGRRLALRIEAFVFAATPPEPGEMMALSAEVEQWVASAPANARTRSTGEAS